MKRLDQPNTLSVINKVEDLERKLKSSESTRQRAQQQSDTKTKAKLNQLERQNRLLEEETKKLKIIELPQQKEKNDDFSKRELAFSNQIGWLMDITRRESKRMVLER